MVQSPTALITGTEIQRPLLLAFVRPPTRHCIERRDAKTAKTSGLKGGDTYGLKGGVIAESCEFFVCMSFLYKSGSIKRVTKESKELL